MSDSTRVVHRPRRGWPPGAPNVVAMIAMVSLAVPVVAFGSSQSTNTQKALAYSRCMRSHGVPSYPDPTSNGVIPKVSSEELNSPQFRAAARACQRLLPPRTDDMFPPGEVQQLLIGML